MPAKKEKEATPFSWSLLFFVTSVSFFSFGGFVKLINGSPDHADLFFKIGIISAVTGSVVFIFNLSVQLALKKGNVSSSHRKTK